MRKQIGFIGLGKMGYNMVLNLLDKKYEVIVYNRSPEPTRKIAKRQAIPSFSIEEFVSKIKTKPKIIWIMITAGKPVDTVIGKLLPYLKKGDIIIEGGNSFYETSMKRYKELKKKGINFIDCGVSGGIEGARKGACMMVGGDKNIYRKIEPLLREMSVKDGYGFMGTGGAGHFVKGIHNGIEYGMIGALNEGLEAIEKQSRIFGTDLKEVARVYNNGSIIQGRLTQWLFDSFSIPKYLDEVSCEVPKGDTEIEMKALDRKFNMPILHQAHLMRLHSRKNTVCGRFIAAIRHEFGGHPLSKTK
jgi:6-phosphogluconate dehydrogenase